MIRPIHPAAIPDTCPPCASHDRMPRCPVCLGSPFSVLRNADELACEVQMRSQFIVERSPRPLSSGKRKDLTDFFHNEKAQLLTCTRCTEARP